MKVAVTAKGSNPDAAVDPRFGRCSFFLIFDTDTMAYEALENSNAQAGGGAGISSAQLVVDHGVDCVLTGNCGPKAFRVLAEADIDVVVGCSGRAGDVVAQYKNGALSATSQPNVNSHFGTSASVGVGPGTQE